MCCGMAGCFLLLFHHPLHPAGQSTDLAAIIIKTNGRLLGLPAVPPMCAHTSVGRGSCFLAWSVLGSSPSGYIKKETGGSIMESTRHELNKHNNMRPL